MSRVPTTVYVLLATMLLTSLLPITGAETSQANAAGPAQRVGIEGAPVTFPAAGDLPWSIKGELELLHLKTDGTTLSPTGHIEGANTPDTAKTANLLGPTPDPGAQTVHTSRAPTFTYATTAASQEIASISTSLWIEAFTNADVRVTVTKTPPTPAGAAAVPVGQVVIPIRGIIIGAPGASGPALYTNSVLLNPAAVVEDGWTIKATVDAVAPPGSTIPVGSIPGQGNLVVLHYGSKARDSTVTLLADAARVKAWTEDPNGDPGAIVSNFVSPDNAAAEERTVTLRIAHVHADGEIGLAAFPVGFKVLKGNTVLFDSTGTPVGVTPDATQRWGTPPAPPIDQVSAPGVRLTTHQLTYPDTLAPGNYVIRVMPMCPALVTCPTWNVDVPVHVGTTPGTFNLDEPSAEKTILLGQRTTFRVKLTNPPSSFAEETYALQAQPSSLLPGWSATVTPAQVKLPPGTSADAEVTIIPSANAANGQQNTVAVTATPFSSGVAIPLNPPTLLVKLTNQRTTGVEIVNLTAPASEAPYPVSISPGKSRSVPVLIQNLGNGFDRAVISLTGAPAGWTATASPGLVEMQAKSQVATILKIDAPTGANPGDVVTIRMRAALLDNLSKADAQDFAMNIAIRDQFAFEVLDGFNANAPVRSTSGLDVAARLTPSTPGTPATTDDTVVHMLRDQGRDARTDTTSWNGAGLDKDYDQTAMFRLVLRNEGDRADVISLTPYTLTSADNTAAQLVGEAATGDTFAKRKAFGYRDNQGCDGDAAGGDLDGKNDGWLFRMYEPGSAPTFPASPETFTQVRDNRDIQVSVPKGETRVVFVELKWQVPNQPSIATGCGPSSQGTAGTNGARAADPAPGHAVLIEAVSAMDPSKRATHVLNARIEGAGARSGTEDYDQGKHAVFLLADADPVVKQVTTTAGERTATYALRATNAGNEMDTIRITVPQYACPSANAAASQCWEHGFQNIDKRAVLGNDAGKLNGGTCTTPAVANPSASLTARVIAFECTMGAFDEVAFRVFSTAPTSALVGAHDNVRVTVQSRDSFSETTARFDDITLDTTVVGQFALNLLSAATGEVPVYAGQSTAVPVTVKNLGTNKDNYTVDLRDALPNGWSADFSVPNPVFVPAGRQVDLLMFARAPAAATVGTVQKFEVRATSLDSPAVAPPTDNQTIKVQVVPKPTQLNLTGNPQDVIGAPGSPVTLKAIATKHTASTASKVNFTLDTESLPNGWTVHPDDITQSNLALSSAGTQVQFRVTIPASVLGTSRGAIRIEADDGATRPDAITHLGIAIDAPNLGLNLSAPDGTQIYVAPGAATKTRLSVQNLGVGQDVVRLSTEALPSEWSAVFDAQNITLQPLETRSVDVTVTAPASLAAGQSRTLTFIATTQDGVRSDTLQINFTTGQSILGVVAKLSALPLRQVPLEATTFTVTVNNTGDLPDDITMRLAGPFKDTVKAEFTPASLALDPGQGADVTVKLTLPASLNPNLDVPLVIEAASKGPFLKSVGSVAVPLKVLDYKRADVDGDVTDEFAVDRDLDPANGYEQFVDPSATTPSKQIDPVTFLTEAARRRFEVTTIVGGQSTTAVRFQFDPDADRKTDLLINTDNNTQPNVYWDPDRGYSHILPLTGPNELLKDVTKDGVGDYFLDLDGEGGLRFDVFYDPKEGRVGKLIQVDIDNNGALDYVVDSDGDGNPDSGETILFGGPTGTITSIRELVDVDGKGGPDVVIDSNGDGRPDYFIPAGKTAGIAIVLEDIDGDGDDEWTYDSDNDGRRDAYYDPQTGETGFLDPKGDFFSELAEHWYIGALFGVVLVLFVVLLAVTRK